MDEEQKQELDNLDLQNKYLELMEQVKQLQESFNAQQQTLAQVEQEKKKLENQNQILFSKVAQPIVEQPKAKEEKKEFHSKLLGDYEKLLSKDERLYLEELEESLNLKEDE